MTEAAQSPRLARFGSFEIDLHTGELRKNGEKVKLPEQSFQVLAMLLAKPGEVVPRQEIQKRLWPNDTVVEFENSINAAVKNLRLALGDSADRPRFIETLPRRGYRLSVVVSNGEAPAHATHHAGAPGEQGGAQTASTELASRHSFRGLHLILYGAILLLLTGGIAGYRHIQTQRPRVFGFTQITHDGLAKGRTLTDGERLYFREVREDRFVIGQVSVAGGETSTLPIPFANVLIGDISRDGSDLVVISFEGTGKGLEVWSLSLPSGTPRRWGDVVARAVALAPDRRQIIFSQWADIYSASSEGAEPTKLATASNPVSGIRFSPDGRKVRFEVVDPRNGSSSIWEMARDGRGLRPLLSSSNSDSRECCGNWTPDGKYFLFQSSQNGRTSLWVLDESTWGLQGDPKPLQLTNGPLDFSFPVVSNDGKRIFAVGSQPRGELVRYDGKSGFVPYIEGRSVSDASFSADGKWVVYVSIPGGQLWRSRLDGSERLQLTPEGLSAALPRWSPDGRQIVFMGTNFKSDWLAYLISRDGTGLRELVPGAQAGYDPGWSPDGKAVVLTLNSAGSPETHLKGTGSGIATYDLETRKVSLLQGANELFSPRWSPDGRYIAAITNDSLKLMLFDRVNQHWQDLVSLPIGCPTWSHDGQYIYFDTTLSEDPAFFRVRISDHKLERLFSLNGVRRYWGTFGQWTGLTPDDVPLIVRDASSQEIYALDWQAP